MTLPSDRLGESDQEVCVAYEAIEDDELLAPHPYPLDTEGPASQDDTPEADEAEWEFSHGFPDSKRVVRIWVDQETRHLTKIRLSPTWRERLGNRSLGQAFGEAFFLANLRTGGPDFTQAGPEPEVDESLTWEDYPQIKETIAQLRDRRRELEQTDPEEIRWADLVGEKAVGSAAGGAVRVTLSLAGLTEAVVFDRKWLLDARSAEVVAAVTRAHEQAYSKYQPPTFVPGEHEELARQFAAATAALDSIMSKGIA